MIGNVWHFMTTNWVYFALGLSEIASFTGAKTSGIIKTIIAVGAGLFGNNPPTSKTTN